MNAILSITFLAVLLYGVSHSHGFYHGRGRKPLQQSIYRDSTCSCACDDITSLVTIIRALEGKESDTGPVNNENNSHTEELVTQLVNALIQITTQALSESKCHCPNSSQPSPAVPSGTNNVNPSIPAYVGGPSYYNSEGPVSNVEIINNKKIDKTHYVDRSKQYIDSVGGNGGSSDVMSYASNNRNKGNNSGGRNADGGNKDNHSNDMGSTNNNNGAGGGQDHQHQPGSSGSGGSPGGGSPSNSSNTSPTANNGSNTTPTNTGGSNNKSKSDEGLINIDLLNPTKPDNVAEIDLARQNAIGIGLGDHSIK